MITIQLAYDALCEHVDSSNIDDGTLWLRGVRVGDYETSDDDDCIHVSTEGDTTICEARSGRIELSEIDELQAVNILLELSDNVMDMERKLSSFLLDSNLQRITDEICELMQNPVLIVDAQSMMCTMSGEGFEEMIPSWEYAREYGRLPWDALEFVEKDMVFASRLLSSQNLPFAISMNGSNNQTVVCRIQDQTRDFTAFIFILCNNKSIGKGTLQLAELAVGYIRSWIETHQGEQRMFSRADFLTKIVEGDKPSDDEIADQQRQMGLVGKDYVLVRIVSPHGKSQSWTASVMLDAISAVHCFEVRDNLFALCVSYPNLESDLLDIANRLGIRFGLSWRFSDWRMMPEAVNQTEVALSYTADSVSVLNSHCILFYVFSILLSSTSNIEIIHPAIETLAEYDNEHNSDYLRTLWFYLRHERNLVNTAEDLNIHRNSLVYRVRRIMEIIPDVDLEDPEIREHLMMSFRIKGLKDRSESSED